MSDDRYWAALDYSLSAVLPVADVRRGHQRFGQRAAALSAIYLPRLLATLQQCAGDDADFTRQLAELRQTHVQLSAAITKAWQKNQ